MSLILTTVIEFDSPMTLIFTTVNNCYFMGELYDNYRQIHLFQGIIKHTQVIALIDCPDFTLDQFHSLKLNLTCSFLQTLPFFEHRC